MSESHQYLLGWLPPSERCRVQAIGTGCPSLQVVANPDGGGLRTSFSSIETFVCRFIRQHIGTPTRRPLRRGPTTQGARHRRCDATEAPARHGDPHRHLGTTPRGHVLVVPARGLQRRRRGLRRRRRQDEDYKEDDDEDDDSYNGVIRRRRRRRRQRRSLRSSSFKSHRYYVFCFFSLCLATRHAR